MIADNTNEIEEQRKGRDKERQIDHSFINKGDYKRKFDNITNDIELSRLLYSLAKQILEHRNGTAYEDMYWIDGNTNKIVAKELCPRMEKEVSYSTNTEKIIKQNPGLITIHNHPDGFPPSANDFNSNFKNNYSIGIICGHNGKVYVYSANEPVNEKWFNLRIAYFCQKGYNESDAQMEAIKEYSKEHNIKCKEV
ncbi:MAG: hypothetical protein ACI4TK_12885 [Agathobacter sp.]